MKCPEKALHNRHRHNRAWPAWYILKSSGRNRFGFRGNDFHSALPPAGCRKILFAVYPHHAWPLQNRRQVGVFSEWHNKKAALRQSPHPAMNIIQNVKVAMEKIYTHVE